MKQMSNAARCVLAALALGLFYVPPRAHAESMDLLEQLQRFNKILTLVKHNYVDSVMTDELIDGAIEGMLRNLDPHTNYLQPDANDRMQELNTGEYSGIGISFDIVDGVLTVISPMEGSPSWELGIRAGDRIVEIEGENAVGITQSEVMEKLRGPEGTKVTVGIERTGVEGVLPFTITRSKIAIKSVPYHFMIEPGTGYIRMSRFSAHTADELEAALTELEGKGMQRLVLDLRSNSGGYLNQAIEVVDKFIEGGRLVVYTKGRIRGSSEEYFSTEAGTHARFPLIVMINAGSASASEIVSGAIQDWDRGLVVGTTSFGKGLVQRQFPLRGGGSLLLTVAKYYTPSGRLIQRPYKDKDRLTYLSEAGTHGEEDDPSISDEPVEVPGDDETNKDRPAHMTAAGRPVYGGGGITPDIVIDPEYAFTDTQTALLDPEQRHFFHFATKYLSSDKPDLGEFSYFLANWQLDDAVFQRAKRFLLERDSKLSGEALDAEREFIAHWVRVEIAGAVWGPNERYQVIVANDPAVQETLQHFPEATLLAKGDIEGFIELTSAQPADVTPNERQ